MEELTVIQADFICQFKTGDNIKYNLITQEKMYALFRETRDKYLLKPIIIINSSIIEAVLYDFCLRIKTNTREGVHSLPQSILEYVRGKRTDEFETCIVQAEKHDFFGMLNTSFYKKLDTLRKVRNRIHIQNSKMLNPANEEDVFTEEIKILSEKLLEKTMRTMSEKHYRNIGNFVGEFRLPWRSYFDKV